MDNCEAFGPAVSHHSLDVLFLRRAEGIQNCVPLLKPCKAQCLMDITQHHWDLGAGTQINPNLLHHSQAQPHISCSGNSSKYPNWRVALGCSEELTHSTE